MFDFAFTASFGGSANPDAFDAGDITVTAVGKSGMAFAEIDASSLAWGNKTHRRWEYEVDASGTWIEFANGPGVHLIEGLTDGVSNDLRFRTKDEHLIASDPSPVFSVTPNDNATVKSMNTGNVSTILAGLAAGDVVEVAAGDYGSTAFDKQSFAPATPVLIYSANDADISDSNFTAHPVFHRHILTGSSRMVFKRIVWRPVVDSSTSRLSAFNVFTGASTTKITMTRCWYQQWLSTNTTENRNSAEYGGAFIDFTGKPAGIGIRFSTGPSEMVVDRCKINRGKRGVEVLGADNITIYSTTISNLTGDYFYCRDSAGNRVTRNLANECAAFVPDDDHTDFIQYSALSGVGEGPMTDCCIHDNKIEHENEKVIQAIFLSHEASGVLAKHSNISVWGNEFHGAHQNAIYLNEIDGASVGENVMTYNVDSGTYPSGAILYPYFTLINCENIVAEANICYGAIRLLGDTVAGDLTQVSHMALDESDPDADGSGDGEYGINVVFADTRAPAGADVGQSDSTIDDVRPAAGGPAITGSFGSAEFRARAV